ncbi:hypothetical protein EPN18_01295 [bacterium]|nr:MAG: hypothetical protein EPN18_01295 [bacterium]
MFRLRLVIAILLSSLFVAPMFLIGCGAKKEVVKAEAPQKPSKAEYLDMLNKWTKSVKVYDGFDTRLYASATYKERSLREAYIRYYSASYQMDDAYRKSLLDREVNEADRYNEFFFAAYTPEDRWNDFEQRDSLWKLFLEDSAGGRVVPVSVKKLDRSDPLLREMFPYFDLWSSAYIIKFPKYSETGKDPIPNKDSKYLKMTITGIIGKGELIWKIKD